MQTSEITIKCEIDLLCYHRFTCLLLIRLYNDDVQDLFPSLNRYRGYHDNTYPYGYSRTYWHLLTARLAFVFVFQFVVYAVTSFIAWLVPDRPDELEFKVEREKQVIKAVFHEDDDFSDLEEDEDDDDTVVFEDAKQDFDVEE